MPYFVKPTFEKLCSKTLGALYDVVFRGDIFSFSHHIFCLLRYFLSRCIKEFKILRHYHEEYMFQCWNQLLTLIFHEDFTCDLITTLLIFITNGDLRDAIDRVLDGQGIQIPGF